MFRTTFQTFSLSNSKKLVCKTRISIFPSLRGKCLVSYFYIIFPLAYTIRLWKLNKLNFVLKIDIMSYLWTSASKIGTKVCHVSLQNVYKYAFFTKKGFLFNLLNFFLFWHINSTFLLSVTGEQKPTWQWYKGSMHFYWKRIIYENLQMFLVQVFSFFFINRLL